MKTTEHPTTANWNVMVVPVPGAPTGGGLMDPAIPGLATAASILIARAYEFTDPDDWRHDHIPYWVTKIITDPRRACTPELIVDHWYYLAPAIYPADTNPWTEPTDPRLIAHTAPHRAPTPGPVCHTWHPAHCCTHTS